MTHDSVPTFSVFTPTFNRADVLTRCYRSLREQSLPNFEWLIVDDGSIDGTRELVQSWIMEAPFSIIYVWQENGGKHRAINRALGMPLRDYFVFLDSDDTLHPEAIEVLTAAVSNDLEVARTIGVIANIHDAETGECVGIRIPDGVEEASVRVLQEKHGVTGDTMRIYRSSVLQKARLPEYAGELFVPENVLFDQVDGLGVMRIVHDELYRCAYRPDGYSRNIMMHRATSPRGFLSALESRAVVSKRLRLKSEFTIKYQVWSRCFFGDYGSANFRSRHLFLLCLPVASVMFAMRRPRFIFMTWNLRAEALSERQVRSGI